MPSGDTEAGCAHGARRRCARGAPLTTAQDAADMAVQRGKRFLRSRPGAASGPASLLDSVALQLLVEPFAGKPQVSRGFCPFARVAVERAAQAQGLEAGE